MSQDQQPGESPSVALPSPSDSIRTAVDRLLETTRRVADLHRRGRWHGGVFEGWADAALQSPTEPPDRRTFPLADEDSEFCPPTLRSADSITLSTEVEEARQRLIEAGFDLDPRRIDLHQLGVLACRWLAGCTVDEWIRSPRVQRGIDSGLRGVVDRMLGLVPDEPVEDARTLVTALSGFGSAIGPEAEDDPARSDTALGPSAPDHETATVLPAPPRARDAGELPFERLAHYEIEERIGRGGMGDVFKGYERALDRHVAIKVLPLELSRQEDFVHRFRSEATAAARLGHPNVVDVHFIGEQDGHHFFAMRYVEGESLADLLKRQSQLPADVAVPILVQVLSGLAAAHAQGLVHRDVKPGNVLLDHNGKRALVADFGLVKALGSGGGVTATGTVMGTVDYIAPEQGLGTAVDARTDLYSVGVLAFRMLGGRLPFEADSPTAMIYQHVHTAPPLLKGIRPDVPAPLSAVVARLLAKNPDDRYASAEEVLADLRAIRANQPLPSGADVFEVGDDDPGIVAVEDHPATLIVELPTFEEDPELPPDLAATAPTGWWSRLRKWFVDRVAERAPEYLDYLQNTQQQVDGAVDVYARREAELGSLAAEAESVLAELEQQAGEWRQALERAERQANTHVAGTSDAANPDEARLEADRCREELDELESQVAAQREQLEEIRLRRASAASRLQELRSQRDVLNARLRVARARGHVSGGETPAESVQKRPGWFPWPASTTTRKWLAFAGALGVIAIVAFGIHRAFSPVLEEPAAKPDPDSVASTSKTSVVAVPEDVLIRRAPLRQFVGHTSTVRAIALSPDGQLLASADQTQVIVWDRETGKPRHRLERFAENSQVKSLTFDHASKRLASSSAVWDLATGKRTRLSGSRAGYEVTALAFTADDESIVRCHLVSASKWDRVDARTGAILWERELDTVRLKETVAFSVDGDRLAVLESDNVRLYDTTTGAARNVRFEDPNAGQVGGPWFATCKSLNFAEGGRFVVGGGVYAPHAVVWNAETGELVEEHASKRVTPAYSRSTPDGRTLAVVTSDSESDTLWVDAWHRPTEQYRTVLSIPDSRPSQLRFSPDGRRLFVATAKDPLLSEWDVDPGPVTTPNVERADLKFAVPFHDRELYLGATESNLSVWNPGSGLFREFEPFIGKVHVIDISDDGTLAVAASLKGTLCLYNVADGRMLRQSSIHVSLGANRPAGVQDQWISDVCFAPDGRSVLVGTTKSMFVWNVATGAEDYRFQGVPQDAAVARVSPDGQYALWGGYNQIEEAGELRLYDFEKGTFIRRLIGHEGRLWSAAFSEDGRRLITGGHNGNVHVLDVESGKSVARFKPGGYVVYAVALSDDGRRAAASVDFRLDAWDVATGEPIASIETGAVGRNSLSFTRDGRSLVTANEAGRLWKIGGE